jgi:hypothetical protein
MPDWQGNIMEPSARPRILLETVAEDTAMAATLQISSIEAQHIDRIHQNGPIIGSANIGKPA